MTISFSHPPYAIPIYISRNYVVANKKTFVSKPKWTFSFFLFELSQCRSSSFIGSKFNLLYLLSSGSFAFELQCSSGVLDNFFYFNIFKIPKNTVVFIINLIFWNLKTSNFSILGAFSWLHKSHDESLAFSKWLCWLKVGSIFMSLRLLAGIRPDAMPVFWGAFSCVSSSY